MDAYDQKEGEHIDAVASRDDNFFDGALVDFLKEHPISYPTTDISTFRKDDDYLIMDFVLEKCIGYSDHRELYLKKNQEEFAKLRLKIFSAIERAQLAAVLRLSSMDNDHFDLIVRKYTTSLPAGQRINAHQLDETRVNGIVDSDFPTTHFLSSQTSDAYRSIARRRILEAAKRGIIV